MSQFENATEIFDIIGRNMWKLKKKSYEKNMKEFREKYGHYFDEMLDYIVGESSKDKAAQEIADIFTDAIFQKFSKRGKIKSLTQADLNFAMIYYGFPAILLTGHEDATLLCDSILDAWKAKFKDSDISYASYEKIYDGFNEKIFGLF